MGELSAVMPLKLSGRHYGHNVGYCDLLFSSFRHFGLRDVLSEVVLVVVPSEVEAVRRYSRAWSDFPIEIISEDQLLPLFRHYSRPHQIRPWHRQQMIKMECSTIVDTSTYLSLDPDVIAVKPITADLLLPDGLPLLDHHSRQTYAQWWTDSARLLDVPPNLELPGVHATPILYSKAVWARCFARIEEISGRPWAETLITDPSVWTEMSLYYLTLENFFEPGEVHRIGSQTHLHSSVEFWTKGDFEDMDLAVFFNDDNPGLFGVVSSSSRVDPRQIGQRLAQWIPVTTQPYEVHDSLYVKAEELYGKLVRGVRARLPLAR